MAREFFRDHVHCLLAVHDRKLCLHLLRVLDLDFLQGSTWTLVIMINMSVKVCALLLDIVKVLTSLFEGFSKLRLRLASS
jgi:hypothetical protein